VVSALFFVPRAGSAQVARAFARALPAVGWQTIAAGPLGRLGEETNDALEEELDVHAAPARVEYRSGYRFRVEFAYGSVPVHLGLGGRRNDLSSLSNPRNIDRQKSPLEERAWRPLCSRERQPVN
jgi:hypothetical protein